MYVLWQLVKWVAVVLAVILVLALVGVPHEIVSLVLVGAGIGAMIHASQSPYWQYLKHKDLNPFAKTFGKSPFQKPEPRVRVPLSQQLNTSSKRALFVVFTISLATLVITFALFKVDQNYYGGFFDAMLNATNRYHGYRAVFVTAGSCMFFSYLYAFHYAATFAIPVRWLKVLFGWIGNGGKKQS